MLTVAETQHDTERININILSNHKVLLFPHVHVIISGVTLWRVEVNFIVHNRRQKEWIIKISLRSYSKEQHKLISNFNLASFSKYMTCIFEISEIQWVIHTMRGMTIKIKIKAHSLSYIILKGTTLLKGMMARISHTYWISSCSLLGDLCKVMFRLWESTILHKNSQNFTK